MPEQVHLDGSLVLGVGSEGGVFLPSVTPSPTIAGVIGTPVTVVPSATVIAANVDKEDTELPKTGGGDLQKLAIIALVLLVIFSIAGIVRRSRQWTE